MPAPRPWRDFLGADPDPPERGGAAVDVQELHDLPQPGDDPGVDLVGGESHESGRQVRERGLVLPTPARRANGPAVAPAPDLNHHLLATCRRPEEKGPRYAALAWPGSGAGGDRLGERWARPMGWTARVRERGVSSASGALPFRPSAARGRCLSGAVQGRLGRLHSTGHVRPASRDLSQGVWAASSAPGPLPVPWSRSGS